MTENDTEARIPVMVVDDDPQTRLLLRRLIERNGFVLVAECASGEEALEVLELRRPAIVLMDMNMRGISGAETTARMIEKHPRLRVLALTGAGDEDSVAEMIQAGASGYVLKGTDTHDLLKALQDVVAGRAVLAPEITSHVLRRLVELHRSEQERADSIAQLDAMKSDFMNVVSHELNTPLTVIKGNLTMLRDRWDSLSRQTRRSFIESMERQTEHLQMMIEQILTVTAIQRERNDAISGVTDLHAAILEVIEHTDVPRSRVNVDVAPLRIAVDGALVRRVIHSVLDNAVRYTQGQIRVRSFDRGPTVDLQVLDEGPGVPPDFAARLLKEPFVQHQPSLTRTSGGLGFSLYAAARLVELVGGDVSIESDPEAGTSVTIVWPRSPR